MQTRSISDVVTIATAVGNSTRIPFHNSRGLVIYFPSDINSATTVTVYASAIDSDTPVILQREVPGTPGTWENVVITPTASRAIPVDVSSFAAAYLYLVGDAAISGAKISHKS